MCKVLIKEVKGEQTKSGTSDSGKAWTLWLFECDIDVDNTGKYAKRLVKTFDEKIASDIRNGAGKTFEAKKQGEVTPFSYLVEPERKRPISGGPGKTNRHVAFEAANSLVSAGLRAGKYESPAEAASATLRIAEQYLDFLKGGSK